MTALKLVLWYCFWLIILVIIFSSCSTTNKHKSISVTDSLSIAKVDSMVSRAIDSISVKRDNTVTTIEQEDDYKEVTVIEYDTSRYYHSAEDYFPKPIRTTVTKTGIKKEKKTVVADTYDSTKVAVNEVAALKKESKVQLTKSVKTKDVKKTRFSLWWLLILMAMYLVWCWYKKKSPLFFIAKIREQCR